MSLRAVPPTGGILHCGRLLQKGACIVNKAKNAFVWNQPHPTINLDFCPTDYWPETSAALMVANIKGEFRRKVALAALAAGEVSEFDHPMLQSEISEDARDAAGRIHPSLMGGEYLPSYLDGEVEIARMSMKSVTGDVISLRARRENDLLHYRIVDEHETEYVLLFDTSTTPLSMRRLIELIETAQGSEGDGLVLASENIRFYAVEEGDPSFMTVSSVFYPELEAWYREQLEALAPSETEDDSDEA
jgi:hypothetical protein